MGNEHSKNKGPSKISQCDKNGGLNGLAANITTNGLDIDAKTLNQNQQNGKAAALNSATESDYVVIHSDSQQVEVIPEKPATTPETEEADKHEERVQLFDKIFKKKAEREAPIEAENVVEEETHQNIVRDASLPATDTQLETANQKPEALTEAESGTPEQTDDANYPPAEEETNPEESPVMNFFKNLNLTVTVPSIARQMTPTKTSKKETPEVPKDQRQREKQPAPATTVVQVSDPSAASKGMLIPPPPPPELPKLEVKVELSGKSTKPTTSKENPKSVAKSAESPKGKSAKDVLSTFFRSKKVDPSKAGTLEATAKVEPPQPIQEEKKHPSKSSFFSFFKPKAGDPKKTSPAPVKAADTPPVKTKEEPKAVAKSCEVVVDDKAASVAPKGSDSAANAARKSEKRNSIQLFLKHLGQKRHSTDAGVQTEPVTVAPAAK
ncbi:breast carcinoma-amplified sequence 1 isoform X4 [Hippocampus comes]|uniref:breast carcinoma-amplified sequence 1 isoform X4 n=1 Tax=Hippocampus comes TaxID=109280 RepID=UPI00094EDC78|nr:PREDICTED: neurofilament heavy polypeptide-like isoform X4 [Hippocampus comes]